MEIWILFSNRKSCKTTSGYVLRALRFCSRTTIQSTEHVHLKGWKNKMKVLVWPSQSWDLNPTEMLWCDLKHTVHAQSCKKYPPQWKSLQMLDCDRLLGFTFSHRAGRFGWFFPLINEISWKMCFVFTQRTLTFSMHLHQNSKISLSCSLRACETPFLFNNIPSLLPRHPGWTRVLIRIFLFLGVSDEVRDVEMKSAVMTNPSPQPHVFSFLYELAASLFHLLASASCSGNEFLWNILWLKKVRCPQILQLRCVKLPRAAT